MSGVSRFDCFPSDFLNGVIGLTADQIATYTVLLMLQYDSGEPVAYEGQERVLQVRCGLPRKRLDIAVSELVKLGKLSLIDGRLSNRRADKEIIKISEKIRKNSENSEKGGFATQKKWGKKHNKVNDSDRPTGQPTGQPKQGPIPPSPVPRPIEEPPMVVTRTKASRLPDDWVLPENYREWARGKGWHDPAINRQAARMLNWSRSSKNGAKLDWYRAWQNWIDGAQKDNPARDGPEPRSNGTRGWVEMVMADIEADERHGGNSDSHINGGCEETIDVDVPGLPDVRGFG